MDIRLTLFIAFLTFGASAQPQYIAHRGASYLAPENTLAAARLAWKLNADAVEVDIHLTRDQRIMVIHDKDTKRTCSGKKNFVVADTPSLVLRELDAGIHKGEAFRDEKIPFLSEIMETIPPGKKLVVEIKCGSEAVPALRRVLDRSDKADQIVFISFGHEVILNTKKEFPDNACYWLISGSTGLNKKMKKAADGGLEGVNLRYKIINREVMDLAKQLDLEVLTWTVDDPAEAKRLTELGVAGITTNRPGWLKEQIKQD